MGSGSALTSTKPTQIPTQEDPPSPSASLLSFNTDSATDPSNPHHKNTTNSIIFISLVLVTCIALSAASAFAFLFFSSSSSSPSVPPTEISSASLQTTTRPLTKLNHSVVLLISSDGFRFGYQFKTPAPNIHRLIANGTEAETGLIPVFPTLTFPNHYSIVTGLYPAYHGIINNHFADPKTGELFTMESHEPKWWLGEPLWETVAKQGLKASTYFWPGSEVHKGSWTCPQRFCMFYNGSVPFDERVDTVLSYFDLPDSEIPVFMTLYFEDPDHQGHKVGPDDPEITEAVAGIDRMIGKLIDGLEQRGVFEDVTIIMVGDHGMVGTCDKKLIFLDDLAPWIDISTEWVQSYTPLLAIRPPPGLAPSAVVAKMNEGLQSGKVQNGKNLKIYLKEELPSRLHYTESDRIPPIIGMVDEGFKVEQKRTNRQECGGAHGYDNAVFSMRTIFIGHGPQFARGRKVPSFENVQIYNLVTSILNIQGAPNNGNFKQNPFCHRTSPNQDCFLIDRTEFFQIIRKGSVDSCEGIPVVVCMYQINIGNFLWSTGKFVLGLKVKCVDELTVFISFFHLLLWVRTIKSCEHIEFSWKSEVTWQYVAVQVSGERCDDKEFEICTVDLKFKSGRVSLIRDWDSLSFTRSTKLTKYVL